MQDNLGDGYELFASGGGFSNLFPQPDYQKLSVGQYFAAHDPGLPYYVSASRGLLDPHNNVLTSLDCQCASLEHRCQWWRVQSRRKSKSIPSRTHDSGADKIKAIPDVSANGAKNPIIINGDGYLFYGTSISAPGWAGIITLVSTSTIDFRAFMIALLTKTSLQINEERTAIGKSSVGFINPVLYNNPYTLKDITVGSNPNCGSKGFSAVPGWDPVSLNRKECPANAVLTLYRSLVLAHRSIPTC